MLFRSGFAEDDSYTNGLGTVRAGTGALAQGVTRATGALTELRSPARRSRAEQAADTQPCLSGKKSAPRPGAGEGAPWESSPCTGGLRLCYVLRGFTVLFRDTPRPVSKFRDHRKRGFDTRQKWEPASWVSALLMEAAARKVLGS